jgi:dihydroorotate dehydrogenase (NAD+) catalytic subunit
VRSRSQVDLSARVGSVLLASPILTASGTAGHGAELSAFVDLAKLGAVVVKSIAAFAWEGNPAPRVHQTTAGMINSVGLQGTGIADWMENELPDLEAAGATVVASIWGRSVDDYARAAELLADAPASVVAVEVNISCPNTEAGNELFAHSPEMTKQVISACDSANRPLWAKLSPNGGPVLVPVARAAADAGAEAVTVANTFFGLSVNPVTRRPRLGQGFGGVSGPAIHPLAVRAVALVHQAEPDLPIVAAGGAATVEDVVEFALVGASAVQIGTATLADPRITDRLATELGRWCAKQGVASYGELVGSAEFS